MQTIWPMPASGQPRRGRPRTTGSRARLTARSFLSIAGASAGGVTSLITRPRSWSFPSASIAPGRSAPGRPYRTSFMSVASHVCRAPITVPDASRVPDADDLADQRGLLMPFDLHRHLGADAHAVAGHLFGAGAALAHADARSGRARRDEANLVRAIVDAAAPLGDLEQGRGHSRDQGQGQVAVGDRLAAGHLALRTLDVDVDPLMISGRLGELVDHRLIDRDPVRRAELASDELQEILGILDFERGHLFLLAIKCSRGGHGPRHLRRVARLELANLVLEAQGQPDLVPAGQEHLLAKRVDLESVPGAIGRRRALRLESDRERGAGLVVELAPELRDDVGRQDHRQQAVLEAVLMEDVAEARRDHRAHAVGRQRPHRGLARGAAAEVLGGDDDPGSAVRRLVQDEVGPLGAVATEAHVVKQEARVLGNAPVLAEEARRDHAIGVDVREIDRHADGGDARKRFHVYAPRVRTSVSRPVTAAAAAIAGDMRCVRAPLPWRPSKLRFDVDATRSPAAAVSPFIPTHIEQPASRHSKPASTKTRSRPSASAARLISPDPGTIHAGTTARRPFAMRAAARRSSRRLLVHEPMNTRSTVMSLSGVPGLRPI